MYWPAKMEKEKTDLSLISNDFEALGSIGCKQEGCVGRQVSQTEWAGDFLRGHRASANHTSASKLPSITGVRCLLSPNWKF
jgi:hypothetical protein